MDELYKVKEFINLSDSKPKVSTVVATQPKVLKINKKVEAKNKIETKDKVEANTKLLPTQILTPTKVVERIIERPTTIFINQTDPSIIVRLQNLERSNSNNASFNSLQVDRIYDSVNKNISNNSNDITESGTLNSPTFTGTTTITGNTINLSGTNPLIDGTNASGTLSINTTTNRPVTFGSGVVTIPNLNASVVGTITKANNLTGGNSTTLLGSLPYQSDTDTSTLLAPNTTTTKNFLSMTGTGTNGAVPAWSTVTATDVGLGNVTNESKATMFTSPTFTGTVAGFTMGGNIALGANTFTTSNTGLVTNLNADLLDGQHGSYYATASSLGSYVPYTGANANLNLGTYNRIFVYPFDSEYAVIFHDDDVMHPEMLEREVAAMDAHPELAWVGTGLRFIKDNASMRNFKDIKHADVFIYDAPGIVRLILKGFNLCYGSVMYRAVLIEPMDSFTPAYSKWADRPYLVSLSKKGKAGILKERLVNYRVHPGQDSQAVAPDSAQYAINLLLFYKKCLHDLQIASDRRLFYAYVVNSLVPAAIASSRTVAELKRFLEPHFRQNLVKLRYFNARGTARSLRALMRIVRKKLPWKN